MTVTIHPAPGLAGRPALPADKSIAHRAALFAALAEGETEIVGYSDAADPQSTLACLRQLGVQIEEREDSLFITGTGLHGLRRPSEPLDCGNSGTTMRLLAGILATQPWESTMIGDASLSSRPMARIANPLSNMGATVTMTDGHAPLTIRGGTLRAITYPLPMASAQVKSAVLLAGLGAEGTTTVIETLPSRDHTERMLGFDVLTIDGERHVSVTGGQAVRAGLRVVPKDVSAAAFFLVAGACAMESRIEMAGVGLNPSRTALIDVLRAMGAPIAISRERTRADEPLGDLKVEPGELVGVEVGGALIPNLIDEIPVLAVAAAHASGTTVIRDAAELRVKETDRIAETARFLTAMGANVEEREDGLVIHGGTPLHGAEVDAKHDHRIAMAAAVAALRASSPTIIHGAEAASVSFPGFWDALDAVGGKGTAEQDA
ncbi:MAG: 3-phosphoshikimate 1-carboxyvinyltransferase [Bacteroidota bacterium]